jgi:ssDNA-binding Zn-finger/Zn-ribbon topoisomerase 1
VVDLKGGRIMNFETTWKFFFLSYLALTIFIQALCLFIIAKKTNTKHAWLAWIPGPNILLSIWIARVPLYFFLMLLVPLLSIFIYCIIWSNIAFERSRPGWWGIIIALVPIFGLVFLLLLAFSEADEITVADKGTGLGAAPLLRTEELITEIRVKCPKCGFNFSQKQKNNKFISRNFNCPRCRRVLSADTIEYV